MASQSKSAQIRAILAKNPNANAKEVAAKLGCSDTLVSQLRRAKRVGANTLRQLKRKHRHVSPAAIESNGHDHKLLRSVLTQQLQSLQHLIETNL